MEAIKNQRTVGTGTSEDCQRQPQKLLGIEDEGLGGREGYPCHPEPGASEGTGSNKYQRASGNGTSEDCERQPQ